MPFGYSPAPRVFTKIFKPVIAYFRFLGFRVIIFIDDLILIASSYNECLQQLEVLRTAACKNRESSVNDHFSRSLIFCPEIPFSELFSKNIFTSFSDSYFFGNLRKFENVVFVRFSIRQIVQNLLREPSNGKVLKLLQLTPNLIRDKNNHSYPFLP